MLLFGVETWVLKAAMAHNVKGLHAVFLQQVIGQKTRRLGDDSWQGNGVRKHALGGRGEKISRPILTRGRQKW